MATTSTSVKRLIVESDEENEYEQIRKRNVEEKNRMLTLLGITDSVQELNNVARNAQIRPARKKPPKPVTPPMPLRKSARLSGNKIIPSEDVQVKEETTIEKRKREFRDRPESMVPLTLKWKGEYEDEVKPSVQELLPFLRKIAARQPSQLSLDQFKKSLKKLTLEKQHVRKVGTAQTRCMVLHPSEEKLLVITGDKNGYMGFWDVENYIKEVELYHAHEDSIFCMNVSAYNLTKLYATSIGGVIRSCDMEKMQFNDLYIADPEDHTPYHVEISPGTLLVAHGSGAVAVVDERAGPIPTKWIQCHQRSVRTVHRHPFKEYEFATASRVGEAGVWDIRQVKKQKPLLLLSHPKGLKSTFYSPCGGMLLTSCNDDKIRLYAADKPQVIMSRYHNMCTGRWLCPFQAVWHPYRSDVFIMGSLNKPRQVDIYGIHGLSLLELKSECLLTVLSSCQFHKSLPVIAGVNNSGCVHVFKEPK